MEPSLLPILLFGGASAAIAIGFLSVGKLFGPRRKSAVKSMPYESGMDPIHSARRRFDIRFHLVAIAFLVFDVELLFLYPWAVSVRHAEGIDAAVAADWVSSRGIVLGGILMFIAMVVAGLVYDWRKGLFRWR